MVDKFFDPHEFESMRQQISKLKTEYDKVGDDPADGLRRLDHDAFGRNVHSMSTSQAMTGHLSGVQSAYAEAKNKLHAVEQALDGVYEAHLDAEHANKNIFTPKD